MYIFTLLCFVNLDKGKVDRYKEKHEKDIHLESNSLPVVNGESERLKNDMKQRRSRNETEDDSEEEVKHHRHRKHKKIHSEEKHRERKEHRHKSDDKHSRRCDEERHSHRDTSWHHSSKHRHSDKNEKQQSVDSDKQQHKRKHSLRWEFIFCTQQFIDLHLSASDLPSTLLVWQQEELVEISK